MLRIVSKKYIDVYGNEYNDYFANPFDRHTLRIHVATGLHITSSADVNIVTENINGLDAKIYTYGINPIEQGFRVGDTVNFWHYNKSNGNVIHNTGSYIITLIDENSITFNVPWIHTPDDSTQNYRLFNYGIGFDKWEISFNQCSINSNSLESLIDNNVTKYSISGNNILNNIGSTALLSDNGYQSGQYVVSVLMTRIGSVSGQIPSGFSRAYYIDITFQQSGARNLSVFNGESCLKNVVNIRAFRSSTDTSVYQEQTLTDNCSTGWFNEPYNNDVANSTLISVDTNEVAYNKDTDIQVQIGVTTNTKMQFGASWIPLIDESYQNKLVYHQGYHSVCTTMEDFVTFTTPFVTPLTANRFFAPSTNSGTQLWDIVLQNYTLVGTTATFTLRFKPVGNVALTSEGNRLFYIWVKVGNVTHLVFGGQLTKIIDASQPLTTDLFTLQDFVLNDLPTIQEVYNKMNRQDFMSLYSLIPIDTNITYTGLTFKSYVKNTVDNRKFTLFSKRFDFTQFPVNSSGQPLINIDLSSNNGLDSTFLKSKYLLTYSTTNDKLSVHIPFNIGYQDWIALEGVDADFYPNQNNNWINYNTGDWKVYAQIVLETEDVGYFKEIQLPIYDYDTQNDIEGNITLKKLDGTPITAFDFGETLICESIHVVDSMTVDNCYGEISLWQGNALAPFTISAEIPSANNSSNPLTPSLGFDRLQKDIISAGSAVKFTCLINTNVLNSVEDVFMTSKLKINGHKGEITSFVTENNNPLMAESHSSLSTENNA